MSIFGAIKDAIFGGPAAAAEVSTAPGAPSASAGPALSAAAPSASAAPAVTPVAASTAPAAGKPAMAKVDIAAVLDKRDEDSDEDLDWRLSIVDLMKLLDLDSSLKARKQLAKELQYSGDMGDSATMNIWLHKQVMTKLAENGGIVPADLKQ